MPATEARTTFTRALHINASRETVFSYFTDPAKMARWMGIEHRLDPVPGGAFRVDMNGRNVAAAGGDPGPDPYRGPPPR